MGCDWTGATLRMASACHLLDFGIVRDVGFEYVRLGVSGQCQAACVRDGPVSHSLGRPYMVRRPGSADGSTMAGATTSR